MKLLSEMTLTSGWRIGMHDAMMIVEPSTLKKYVCQRGLLLESVREEDLPCPYDQVRCVV